LLARVSTLI
jgi:mitogen-activated protein kinase 1/3